MSDEPIPTMVDVPVERLTPGRVVHLPFAGARTVREVVRSGLRGIVGNRPIWYVYYVRLPWEDDMANPGTSVAEGTLMRVTA